MRSPHLVDPFALAAAAMAAGCTGLYVSIVLGQGSAPASWVVIGLIMAAVLAVYGAVRVVPLRRPALITSTVVLAALGLAAILTIGMVILVGAVLALVASLRAGTPDRSRTVAPSGSAEDSSAQAQYRPSRYDGP